MDAEIGIITLIAGTGEPKALRYYLDDNIIVVDSDNCAVRGIDSPRTGIVTTTAGGRDGGGDGGDGGPANSAGLAHPHVCEINGAGGPFQTPIITKSAL